MGQCAAWLGKNARGDKIGWLAYQAESPAIDESLVCDVHFDIRGSRLPKDHGYAIYLELARILPWFADEPLGGVHPVTGADIGHDELILSRRAKLVVRIASARVGDLMALSRQTLLVEGQTIEIGAGKARPLPRHTPLFSHCVTTGNEDEVEFANDIIRLLDELEIDSRFICGRRQTIRTPDGPVSGYSLMLHGLPVEHSILVQQQGLGNHRKIGCGIFIPHKSINALT